MQPFQNTPPGNGVSRRTVSLFMVIVANTSSLAARIGIRKRTSIRWLRRDGGDYNYVRPLVTIAPTAIRCELPINTEFGYTQIDDLAIELRKGDYQHALIFIAWEHGELVKFAKLLVASYGGDPSQVPFWSEKDYDTIFVFRVRRIDGRNTVAFSIDHEGLSDVIEPCPDKYDRTQQVSGAR